MKGDREAYAELVRRHHPRLIRLCAALLSDRASAEDAAQEVFLKAYRGLSRYRGDASFLTWIRGIAYRHCMDVLRSRARRAESPESALAELQDPAPDPASSLESADVAQKLLNALPEDARAALVLFEMEGLTYEEAARVLDCSLEAFKSRLRRARESALDVLKKRGLYGK